MVIPAIGGAEFVAHKGPKVIRLALHGHANRPFYHIVLSNTKIHRNAKPVELLGSYDPMPNKDNQKLLSLNVERMRFWMGQDVRISKSLYQILGRAGFVDIHPRTYQEAWRQRYKLASKEKETGENEEKTS